MQFLFAVASAEPGDAVLGFVILAAIAAAITWHIIRRNKQLAAMPPYEREKFLEEKRRRGKWGQLNQHMVCPHCRTRGVVRVRDTFSFLKRSKARGGLGTMKEAHCDRCEMTWEIV